MPTRSRREPEELEERLPTARPIRRRSGWLLGGTAALAAALLLAGGWAASRRADLRALLPGAQSGNLLVNGSFEQPPGSGIMQTFGPPWSRWQKLQFWFRSHWVFPARGTVPMGVPIGMLAGPAEMPGWRVSRGTVDVTTRRYWQPAPGQGAQNVDLVGSPGAATIEQTIFTRPGQEYLFSGWLAHNPENPVAPMALADVYLNDRLLVRLRHHDPAATRKNMRWRPFAYRFRATSVRTTLKLKDVTNTYPLCGTVVDGLAITLAPPRVSRSPAPH
jgi:uncharacterized protein DUF642